jgi:DNA mismatch endonuclease (patch repair protein)
MRYRLHHKTPAGRPDVAFVGRRVAVFVDGCFWHGCPDHYVRPRSRSVFWAEKLAANVARDRRQTTKLESLGWRVCRFWEHDVFVDLNAVVDEVRRALTDCQWAARGREVVWRVDALSEVGDQERRHLGLLREPERVWSVDQARHTRKWTRPK